MKISPTLRMVGLFGLLLALAAAGPVAPASSFNVNSNVDSPDVSPGNGTCADISGHCTLRAAVMEANAHTGPDTIVLPSGTLTLTIAGADEDGALTGDLDITGTVTLRGAGLALSRVDATGLNDRIFDVLPGAHASLSDLTIQHGTIPVTGLSSGGGVLNAGTLTLTRVSLTHNNLGDESNLHFGGALANIFPGSVAILSSQVISNEAELGALSNEYQMTLVNSVVMSNVATFGAGLYNQGTLNMQTTQVLSNTGAIVGGGFYARNGQTTVSDSLINGNQADYGGAFWVHDATVSISRSTLRANQSKNSGGALQVDSGSVELVNTTLLLNGAADDGGALNVAGGQVSALNTTLTQNHAEHNGGAVNLVGGVLAGYNLTIIGNIAHVGGQGVGTGGGIYHGVAGTVTLSNTILSENLHATNTPFSVEDDCAGTTIYMHYSRLGTATGCTFNSDNTLTGEFLDLLPLGDYGGSSLTIALGPLSAAIDKRDVAGCTAPFGLVSFNQRDLPRPVDGTTTAWPAAISGRTKCSSDCSYRCFGAEQDALLFVAASYE
ncbi:MAG: hypothetical protein ABI847_03355 [Anaerolineales bacterium]